MDTKEVGAAREAQDLLQAPTPELGADQELWIVKAQCQAMKNGLSPRAAARACLAVVALQTGCLHRVRSAAILVSTPISAPHSAFPAQRFITQLTDPSTACTAILIVFTCSCPIWLTSSQEKAHVLIIGDAAGKGRSASQRPWTKRRLWIRKGAAIDIGSGTHGHGAGAGTTRRTSGSKRARKDSISYERRRPWERTGEWMRTNPLAMKECERTYRRKHIQQSRAEMDCVANKARRLEFVSELCVETTGCSSDVPRLRGREENRRRRRTVQPSGGRRSKGKTGAEGGGGTRSKRGRSAPINPQDETRRKARQLMYPEEVGTRWTFLGGTSAYHRTETRGCGKTTEPPRFGSLDIDVESGAKDSMSSWSWAAGAGLLELGCWSWAAGARCSTRFESVSEAADEPYYGPVLIRSTSTERNIGQPLVAEQGGLEDGRQKEGCAEPKKECRRSQAQSRNGDGVTRAEVHWGSSAGLQQPCTTSHKSAVRTLIASPRNKEKKELNSPLSPGDGT
ncbi:hypothetical protein C8R45DRAFT_1078124 [Mycena sanguinolenta]|nr:hypothetical protein C8R45DRAFT_1078124 [Mycena sanguinolenta]